MRRSWSLLITLLACLLVGGPLDVHAQALAADRGPVPVNADDPSWGNDDAPVTLVVFTDLQCPFCKRLDETVEKLRNHYGPKRLRVVYKHYPLAFHKRARPAAEAAEAVRRLSGNAGFWDFTREAFQQIQGAGGGSYRDVLASLKMDRRRVERLMKGGKASQKVDADMQLAQKLGVRGTPHSFVNGVRLSGAQPFTKFVDVVDEQLTAARKLMKRGVKAKDVYVRLAKANYAPPAPPKPAARGVAAGPSPSDDTTTVWKVPVDGSPVRGPMNAPVTLVLFSDVQCPFCARLEPTIAKLRTTYPNELRVVFKHNPLPFHKRAEPAAQLAIEARVQKGDAAFFDTLDALFASNRNLEDADLESMAQRMGLHVGRAMAAVKASKHAKVIEADTDLGDEVGVRGTPCSFINGRRLTGARGFDDFASIIDEEIAHAKQLRAKGVPAARIYDSIIAKGQLAPVAEVKSVAAPGRDNPTRGGRNAKVTIQMFTDFECPFCGRVQDTLAQIDKEFGANVRFVYRHMPLDFHTHAMAAHEAAAEAFKQGGNKAFWKMHDLMFANQSALDHSSLLSYGKQAGLDVAKLDAALAAKSHHAAIQKDREVAEKAGITGTPAFVINGYFISGAQPFSKFKRVIKRALAEAKSGKKPIRRAGNP